MKALAWVWLLPIFLFKAVRSYVVCVASPVRGREEHPIPTSFPSPTAGIRPPSGDRSDRPWHVVADRDLGRLG